MQSLVKRPWGGSTLYGFAVSTTFPTQQQGAAIPLPAKPGSLLAGKTMRRGQKPELPDVKRARGTFQPCEDANRVSVIEPDSPPQQPDWLTSEGSEVWLDDIGRVLQSSMLSEQDSTIFATYCNLQGAAIKAWRSGDVPPVSAVMEIRKMAELFGLCGHRSRMSAGPAKSNNPFLQRKA